MAENLGSMSFGQVDAVGRRLALLLMREYPGNQGMSRDEIIDWIKANAEAIEGDGPVASCWQLPDGEKVVDVRPDRAQDLGPFNVGGVIVTPEPQRSIDAAALLEELAERFRERNGKYKDNWRNLGAVMTALYPNGITLRTADDFVKFHLLEWTIGKLTRYVNAEDGDSIEDGAVYMAMIGSYLRSLA